MTADLAALIRAKLDTIGEGNDDCRMQCGRSCAEDGYDDVVAALLAVLDVTDPNRDGHPDCDCPSCVHERVTGAVAKALGIEVAPDA